MSVFVEALQGRNRGRPPIWLMRQAGRYLPKYRELRQKWSFLQLCRQPDLIAEVTMLPIRTFGMDAAIVFSDILLILEALGVGLQFQDATGPLIERPLEKAADVHALPRIQARESLSFVSEGIKLLKQTLSVPLIGFAGAPFTLASYIIEGKTSRSFEKTKRWMYADPASFHQLLDLLTDQVIGMLEMQIEAGVDALQLFDSWAGTLAYPQFCSFSLAYLQKIIQRIKGRVPLILFCKGASSLTTELTSIGPNGISFDWNVSLPALRTVIPSQIAIQGNLDPQLLHAPLNVIRAEAQRLMQGMRGDPRFIFNLGHGILPDTPVEAVRVLVETVQQGESQ
jgi:uroporphyrinogen decarboxylase